MIAESESTGSDSSPTIAVLADVHGNRWALEAVLHDLAQRRPDRIVNLGDTLYGPLDPAGTAEILMALDPLGIRGNQDRVLLEPPPAVARHPTFQFVASRLREDQLAWLATHRDSAVVDGRVRLCHGTPEADDEYLLEEVTSHGVELRSDESLRRLLAPVSEPVLLCAHSHVPRAVVCESTLVVNPGSVGLPAYKDEGPHPHRMESGTPHARYALLTGAEDGAWQVEHVAVPYDWPAAAACAARNGREDWAAWLRTGRG